MSRPTSAQEPVVPPVTDVDAAPGPEVRAASAKSVLARHCAGCHQHDLLERLAPEGRLGAITDLDWLSRSHLVTPGNADASILYARLHEQHAPLPLFRPHGTRTGPTPTDIDAVRGWIEGLSRTDEAACGGARATVDRNGLVRAALIHLAKLASDVALRTRFLSLGHLWNACATPDEIAGYAGALQTAMNAVTWQAVPVRLTEVELRMGAAEDLPASLFAVDLTALGWSADEWEAIAREATGPRLQAGSRLADALAGMTGARAAILAGDSFAAAVLRSDRYASLLRLPDTVPELSRRLGIDAAVGAGSDTVASVARSRVTAGQRKLSLLTSPEHRLWLAEDPVTGTATRTRALFRLPNGTPAFAVFDGLGRRIDGAAASAQQLEPVSCQTCHGGGARLDGEVRAPIANGRGGAEGLTAGPGFVAAIDADARTVQPLQGLDPVVALVAAYEAPVGLRRAAAEYGVDQRIFTGILSEMIAGGDFAARALSGGPISRAAFERLLDRLATADHGVQPAFASEGHEIAVWTDREVYAPGDAIQISVVTSRTCHPTIVSIDDRNEATVLYPSGMEPGEPIAAGAVLTIPGDGTGYSLRAGRLGRETVLALCAETEAPVLAMLPDYSRQVFSILGDWRMYLIEASRRFQESEGEARTRIRDSLRGRTEFQGPKPVIPRPVRLSRAVTHYEVRR